MKLVVGLGNIGNEFKKTRHNVGFMVLDNYLNTISLNMPDWQEKMESYFYKIIINNEEVIFIKPMTYMNLSGIAVAKVSKYYNIAPENILVIQDDVDLPLASYRMKKNSSFGGHNGIKSIISELNTDAFGRLKIGIGKNPHIPTDKYVLGKFSNEELETLKMNYANYNRCIDLFINENIDSAIFKYKENIKD